MAFLFFICKGFEQGGSRHACGRKQSCGLFLPTRSRSIATRRHTTVCRKIPCSPPKMKKLYRKVWLFYFLFARDSNKEGAGTPAEENSPADCFCRRGQGASRREGIRQYAEKIPCSLHSHIAKFCLFFVLIFNQMYQQLSGNICQCNFSIHLVFAL